MHMTTKHTIFEEKAQEYWKADKRRKGEILDAVCEISGLTRKGAIKRFRRMQTRHSRTTRAGRKTYYTKDVDVALYEIWEAANRPCGVLLHPLIPEYVAILIRDGMWKHGDETTSKLLAMKCMTVRRRCTRLRTTHEGTHGLSTTKPSHLKQIIPIFKGPWVDALPGEGQIDTVAHCGSSLSGDFIRSVCYTDAATYWVIPRAQWNNGRRATVVSVEEIEMRLPVLLLHLHPDTGSEFINWHLKEWCDEHTPPVRLTRSEPGKKNDNMYVEERNGHVVRKYLGYTRFDCPLVVPIINEFYDTLALYLNHFQAVRRTLSKERVGAKYRRVYEKVAKTPYQRMLEHAHVSEDVKAMLRAEHEALNPLLLKQKLDTLWSMIIKIQRDHGLGKCACGRS